MRLEKHEEFNMRLWIWGIATGKGLGTTFMHLFNQKPYVLFNADAGPGEPLCTILYKSFRTSPSKHIEQFNLISSELKLKSPDFSKHQCAEIITETNSKIVSEINSQIVSQTPPDLICEFLSCFLKTYQVILDSSGHCDIIVTDSVSHNPTLVAFVCAGTVLCKIIGWYSENNK